MISFQQMGFESKAKLCSVESEELRVNIAKRNAFCIIALLWQRIVNNNSQLSTLNSSLAIMFAFNIAFALQIEAPPEIMEQISAYAGEIAQNPNQILRVDIEKGTECNRFKLKLIDKRSGKTLKKLERCSADLPNAALQNAVLEIFGQNPVNSVDSENSALKTILFGAGFVGAGLLLYYSQPPEPVYGRKK